MAEAEFPSNSMTGRQPRREKPEAAPEKEVKQVTTGEVIRRKKPLGKRVKETFVGGDARSVWSIVTLDVIVPAAKDMIVDAGREMLERMVFGESRGPRRSYSRSGGYTPYHRASVASTRPVSGTWSSASSQREAPQRDISARGRAKFDFDEILLDSRAEAEQIIDGMNDIIETYEVASVSDLYALAGSRSSFTDRNWGWTSLRGAGVSHVRGGRYLLNLPKPEPID